jgi:hypothetical protein
MAGKTGKQWRMEAIAIVLVAISSLGGYSGETAARGQEWARAMFDNHTTHDFGTVARGAKVEHRFVFENIYEEDLHVQSVSSSCGCSTPQVNRKLLKTWEKGEVLVTIDTRTFFGRKDATIAVVFDKPFSAEVQLHVHTNIRSDIVVQPGAVLLGSVLQGAEANQTVNINYAGRSDWKITRVECTNPAIVASIVETNRAEGQVAYRLAVRLKPDAAAGYIRDQLSLVTNDRDTRAARVPVAVEGVVVAALSVRPSPLMMGTIEAGRSVTRNIVVQGRTPFRITAVRSSDKRFQCQTSNEPKTTHVLPVTFTAKDLEATHGVARTTLRIETDRTSAGAVEVAASVQILPPGPAKP